VPARTTGRGAQRPASSEARRMWGWSVYVLMPATVADRHARVDYLTGNAMRAAAPPVGGTAAILTYRVPVDMRRRSATPLSSISAPAATMIHSSVPVNGSLPLLADRAGVTEALAAPEPD
jgi:hypothetical protein